MRPHSLISGFKRIHRSSSFKYNLRSSSHSFSSFRDEDFEALSSASNDKVKAVKKIITGGSLSAAVASSLFPALFKTFSSSSSVPHTQSFSSKNFYLLEGYRSVSDALASNHSPLLIFLRKDTKKNQYQEKKNQLLDSLADPHQVIFSLEPRLFDSLSETVSSQGVLGLFYKPPPVAGAHKLSQLYDALQSGNTSSFSQPVLSLCLNDISDPGNMGTLIRTAYGLGLEEVLLLGERNASPNSQKVIRSSMGMLLRTEIHSFFQPHALIDHFVKSSFLHYYLTKLQTVTGEIPREYAPSRIFIADLPTDSRPALRYDQADFTGPSLLVIGSESRGPDTEGILATLSDLRESYPTLLQNRDNNGTQQVKSEPKSLDAFFEAHVDEAFLQNCFPSATIVSIPMLQPVESYNAATAGSIILAEAMRQRNFQN